MPALDWLEDERSPYGVEQLLASARPEAPSAELPGGIGFTGSAFSLPLGFLDQDSSWSVLLGYRDGEMPAESQASAGWLAAWNPADVWVDRRLSFGLEWRAGRERQNWSLSLTLQRDRMALRNTPVEDGVGALLELALSF